MTSYTITVKAFNEEQEDISFISDEFEKELCTFLIQQIEKLDLSAEQKKELSEIQGIYWEPMTDLKSFWLEQELDERPLWSIVETDIPGFEDEDILDDLEYLIGMAKKMEESEDNEKAVPIFAKEVWVGLYKGDWNEFDEQFLGLYKTENDYVQEQLEEGGYLKAIKDINPSANIDWFDLDYLSDQFDFVGYEVEGGVCIFSN